MPKSFSDCGVAVLIQSHDCSFCSTPEFLLYPLIWKLRAWLAIWNDRQSPSEFPLQTAFASPTQYYTNFLC